MLLTMVLMVQQQSGPWNGDLKWAEVSGGKAGAVSFHIQSAGVPSMVKTKKGDIWAVFQWFPFNERESWDQVAIQRSRDNGQSWNRPTSIKVEGLPVGYQRPMDPTIVELADGRLRLYFTSNPDGFGLQGNGIYSAISSDGAKWKFEPGQRFRPNDQNGYDPAVVFFEGKWHMITPKRQAGGYHATSADGLKFTQIAVIDDPGYDWIGNLFVFKGKLTFFGGGAGLWSRTLDGGKWSEAKEYGLKRVGDPAVVSLGGDRLGVLYVGPPAQPR